MKRALVLGSLAALLTTGLTSVIPAQAATVRADAKCASVGQSVQVRGTTYRCTTSGTSSVWRVQANTVRVGRGCTREGELATVGTSKTLFSCTVPRGARQLTWKRAGKECIGAVGDYNGSLTTYRNLLAQLAQVKAEAAQLNAEGQAQLARSIADLEQTVKAAQSLLNDSRSTVGFICSF